MDLLWPQPPLTCSSHHDSTPGPLISVVAACVKDARPSRWLAPLATSEMAAAQATRAPPADPSLSAVESVELAGGEQRRGQQRSVTGRAASHSRLCRAGSVHCEQSLDAPSDTTLGPNLPVP